MTAVVHKTIGFAFITALNAIIPTFATANPVAKVPIPTESAAIASTTSGFSLTKSIAHSVTSVPAE